MNNTTNSNEGQDAGTALAADNSTPDKPDHLKARACVFVDGMSALGFNPTAKRAEFAFFKSMHFPLEMKIFNAKGESVWSTENEKDFPYSTLGATITINSTKTGMGQRYERIPRTDDEDFRNMPDLPEWHDVAEMKSIPDPKNAFLSARLYVCDAVFYTYRMSVNNATRYENTGSKLINPVPLGRIGRIPGADIFCQPTEDLEIEIKSDNISTPVKVMLGKDDNPYQIVIRVTDEDPNDPTSHLALLYDILQRPAGDKRTFALRFDAPEPACLFGDEVGIESNQYECQVFKDSEGSW